MPSGAVPIPAATPGRPVRVAVVGAGLAGLAAAHTLQGLADLTLFEADRHFGGQSRTVDVTLPDANGAPVSFAVNIDLLVINERASPNLAAQFAACDLPLARADMSFSVQVPQATPGGSALEWRGGRGASLLAQRRNLASPRFLRMLADAARFRHIASRLRLDPDGPVPDALQQPLADFLRARHLSTPFRDWCLLPLVSGLCGDRFEHILAWPAATALRLLHRHGLLHDADNSMWHTVAGGTRRYVHRIVEGLADRRLSTPVRQVLRDETGVRLVTDDRVERFDAVVLACHSDQALALLGADASPEERERLGAIRYRPSRALLHLDTSVLPGNPRAWATWNHACEPGNGPAAAPARASLHVLMNRLQPLPVSQPVLLSLNPAREIAPEHRLGERVAEHPVFDLPALHSLARLNELQGRRHTWFAGAWTGDGSHEEGLRSGLRAARAVIDHHDLLPVADADEVLRDALPGVFAG